MNDLRKVVVALIAAGALGIWAGLAAQPQHTRSAAIFDPPEGLHAQQPADASVGVLLARR